MKEDSLLPDFCFRILNKSDEEQFRLWAREHTDAEDLSKAGMYHPVVRDEWKKLGLEF